MACIVFKLEDGSTITTPLEAETTTLGRADDNVMQLADPSVSSHHAVIKYTGEGFFLQDMRSSNGTRLNGVLVEEALLQDGDRVAFGDVLAVFYVNEPALPPPAPEVVEEIKPLVVAAAPVTGIPHGAGRYNPKLRPVPRRTTPSEGEGCMNFFLLCLLCFGAFAIGLSLRHYEKTERFLPNDLAERLFSKMGRLKIEMPEDEKKE